MGQKVHPTGIRLGIIKDWTSKWYADSKDYADLLNTDLEVRAFLKKKLSQASVSRIQIDRPAKNAHITIHTARPGLVIGKKGEDIDALRADACVGELVVSAFYETAPVGPGEQVPYLNAVARLTTSHPARALLERIAKHVGDFHKVYFHSEGYLNQAFYDSDYRKKLFAFLDHGNQRFS